MDASFQLRTQLVDVHRRTIRPVTIHAEQGRIREISPSADAGSRFTLPGFVDAHIHVESSMLTPAEFARAAVVHGTVATVSDPHEIANVLGVEGIRFMLDNAASVPLKFFYGVPSCVPATDFETAGARLPSGAVQELLADPRLPYLAEMMNFPGVLSQDAEVMAKVRAAREAGKPIDGHAPGLRGSQARAYIDAGITTDHECTTMEEALDKLVAGCKVQIRQGSAARNFDALYSLIDQYPQACMLCSDDRHPDDLIAGHINLLVRDAVARGQDLFHVLRCASINPIEHYGLDVGQLRVGDPADMITVSDLHAFDVITTYIDGRPVAERGKANFAAPAVQPLNRFATISVSDADWTIPATSSRIRVIEAMDGELITRAGIDTARIEGGLAVADPSRDLLKLTVVNRYAQAPAACGFIRGFGLTRGALASTVAHDCHNIVAVGADDESLTSAVRALIGAQGGLCVAADGTSEVLPLPIGGLMSTGTCAEVAAQYSQLNVAARRLGTQLRSPFMTLSFMALLVIPALKLSDRGLFDVERFQFVPLFV